MINIESLKDYIGNVSEDEFMKLAIKIYMVIDFICEDYPNYKEWYFNKQLPETIKKDKKKYFF